VSSPVLALLARGKLAFFGENKASFFPRRVGGNDGVGKELSMGVLAKHD
jgi:hypothetical protein